MHVLAYEDGANRVTADSHRRYFLPRVDIKEEKKFLCQRINNQEKNDLIKQYDELGKVSIGEGGEYTAGCLLDFAYLIKSTD